MTLLRWLAGARGAVRPGVLVAGGVAVSAVAVAVALTVSTGTGNANLWVDTTGGTCTRQVSAGGYVDAQACSSIQTAIAACTPGDAIRMKAGAYGAQAITTNRTSACPVVAEDGTSTGTLSTNANNIDITNIDTTRWDLGDTPTGQSGVTLRNVDVGGAGISYLSGPASNITMIGGSFHDIVDGGNPGGVFVVGNSSGEQINAVTFNGVAFTNIDCVSTPGNHFEALRIQGYVNGMTVRNSSFTGNAVDSSQIFYTSFNSGTEHTPTGTHIIENTVFGPPEAGTCGGAAFLMVDQNMQSGACPNLTVRYNTAPATFIGPVTGGSNCSSGATNIKITANISAATSSCGGPVYSSNLWIGSASCGTGDQSVANSVAAGLTGDGFHINGTSPARAAGKAGDCPTDDRDSDTRPNPALTTCDAGADEVG